MEDGVSPSDSLHFVFGTFVARGFFDDIETCILKNRETAVLMELSWTRGVYYTCTMLNVHVCENKTAASSSQTVYFFYFFAFFFFIY